MKPNLKTWALFAALAALLFIYGCSTQKKEIERLHGLNSKYPNELAKDCADKFPVKDSVGKPVITYVNADNKNYQSQIDSLQQMADDLRHQVESGNYSAADAASLKNQVTVLTNRITALKREYKACKPDTARIEVPHYIENTARINVLQNELKIKTDSLTIYKTNLKNSQEANSAKLKWIIGLALLLGIGVFLKIRRII